MAVRATTHRAVTVGISGGLGVLLPALAYAATIPFDAAHQVVAACATPFAVGTVAGVGLLALSSALADRRASRAEGGVHGKRAAAAEDVQAERAAAAPTPAVKGVPVIARASNALSDEDAWADIESMLSEDSLVSCDPVRSKDIYEIALAELRRGEESAAMAEEAPIEATASMDKGTPVANSAVASADSDWPDDVAAPAAEPTSTAVFIALAGGLSVAEAQRAAHAAPPAPRPQTVLHVEDDRLEDDEARDTALASLYGLDRPAAAREPEPASAIPTPRTAYVTGSSPEDEMAAREALWARAWAIMENDVDPAAEEERPHGRHFAPAPSALSRSAAVSEGVQSTAVHSHVNALLNEELLAARSQSVRRTGREYLRVIQGGTASLPRMQAEA